MALYSLRGPNLDMFQNEARGGQKPFPEVGGGAGALWFCWSILLTQMSWVLNMQVVSLR